MGETREGRMGREDVGVAKLLCGNVTQFPVHIRVVGAVKACLSWGRRVGRSMAGSVAPPSC